MKRKSQKAEKKPSCHAHQSKRKTPHYQRVTVKKGCTKIRNEKEKRKVKRNAGSGRAKPTARLIKSARGRQQQQQQRQQTEPSSNNNKGERRRQLESTSRRSSAC